MYIMVTWPLTMEFSMPTLTDTCILSNQQTM